VGAAESMIPPARRGGRLHKTDVRVAMNGRCGFGEGTLAMTRGKGARCAGSGRSATSGKSEGFDPKPPFVLPVSRTLPPISFGTA
jgi:hypothetical protein